jgi:hypothetical protein
MPCEKVSFARKAIDQISHHRKDGVTEAWTESIVRDTPDTKRDYLKDGSFTIKVRTRKPSGADISVFIYAREKMFKIEGQIIWRECNVYGIHVEGG